MFFTSLKKEPIMPKIVVYTAIFGNLNKLIDPLFRNDNVDYIVFTDNKKFKSNIWTTKIIKPKFKNPRIMSRLPKILSHKYLPKHDISIYLDSDMTLITKNVYKMVEECLEGHEMALYRHYDTSCLYEHLDVCLKLKLVGPEIAHRIRNKYMADGFPHKYGLFENGLIIRKNSEKMNKLNELWWDLYSSGSERDQLSLMYSLWKTGITANAIKIGKQVRINPYVTHGRSKKR